MSIIQNFILKMKYKKVKKLMLKTLNLDDWSKNGFVKNIKDLTENIEMINFQVRRIFELNVLTDYEYDIIQGYYNQLDNNYVKLLDYTNSEVFADAFAVLDTLIKTLIKYYLCTNQKDEESKDGIMKMLDALNEMVIFKTIQSYIAAGRIVSWNQDDYMFNLSGSIKPEDEKFFGFLLDYLNKFKDVICCIDQENYIKASDLFEKLNIEVLLADHDTVFGEFTDNKKDIRDLKNFSSKEEMMKSFEEIDKN